MTLEQVLAFIEAKEADKRSGRHAGPRDHLEQVPTMDEAEKTDPDNSVSAATVFPT